MRIFKNAFRTNSFKYNKLSTISRKYISLLADPAGLTEDQITIQASAINFARNELLPNAGEWDENKHFPKDVYRKAAELGFGGIYVNEKYGGSGLGRMEASVIFEGLSTGCVGSSAYLSIANMCCWMVDQFGNEEQKLNWLPKMCSLEVSNHFHRHFQVIV